MESGDRLRRELWNQFCRLVLTAQGTTKSAQSTQQHEYFPPLQFRRLLDGTDREARPFKFNADPTIPGSELKWLPERAEQPKIPSPDGA